MQLEDGIKSFHRFEFRNHLIIKLIDNVQEVEVLQRGQERLDLHPQQIKRIEHRFDLYDVHTIQLFR